MVQGGRPRGGATRTARALCFCDSQVTGRRPASLYISSNVTRGRSAEHSTVLLKDSSVGLYAMQTLVPHLAVMRASFVDNWLAPTFSMAGISATEPPPPGCSLLRGQALRNPDGSTCMLAPCPVFRPGWSPYQPPALGHAHLFTPLQIVGSWGAQS